MTVSNQSLEMKLQEAVGPKFKVVCDQSKVIFFKNLKVEGDDYVLYREVLTEHEILEVGKILGGVYKSFTERFARNKWSDGKSQQTLNRNSESSAQFIGAIVNLQGSALHKLLLLISGERFLSGESVDLVITLAQTKHEARFYPDDITTHDGLYGFLKKYYILPGISPLTRPDVEMAAMNVGKRRSILFTSRLMAFLANSFENLTLSEYLELDFSEAIIAKESLKDLNQINYAQRIRMSNYEDLAYSMTARELRSLSQILNNATPDGRFPKDMLRSRSKAMDNDDAAPLRWSEPDSILRYLSKDEQNSLSSDTFSQQVNYLLDSDDVKAKTPPVIYAALAEILSVKGERRTLEVAGQLEHMKFSRDRNLKMYEATVAIITEALDPGNNALPYGWVAQMSEHAWVLTSHIQKRKQA